MTKGKSHHGHGSKAGKDEEQVPEAQAASSETGSENGGSPGAGSQASGDQAAAAHASSSDGGAPSQQSSGVMEELRKQLNEKEEEARKNHDQFLRTMADLDNFRKRVRQEKEDAISFANADLILQLLPILDNFDLALQHAETDRNFENLFRGVSQIFKQMRDTLQKFGVEPIEAVGKPFNPDEHEAIGQTASDDHETGSVTQDLRTGYRMKGRCIRPSLVRVAG